MTETGEEEGRKLNFVSCPLSGYNIWVESTKKDNNVVTCSTGCGSGLGFSHFASMRGGFSGCFKEGGLGMNGKREHDTSRKNLKRVALEEDPDFLPQQESFIQSIGGKNRGDSVGKRSKLRYNQNGKNPFGENDGMDVSKCGSQSTFVPNNQKQLMDVVAVDEKVKKEYRNPDGCSRAVIKDIQSIVNINQDGKLHGVRRSKRINGRHVPVYTELDIEISDDIYHLDPCDSLNTFTTNGHHGTQEPDDGIDNEEASPMPKEITYKEVNEASTSGITDEKAILDKQKPDEEAHKKPSAMWEELRSEEIHKQSVFHVEDEKGKTGTFVNLLSQDMLPLERGTDNKSDNEDLPMVRERRYREIHDIFISCTTDGKAKSCNDFSSKGAQKLDSSRASVVNNGKDRDGDINQHSESDKKRRSERINGKHVPVDGDLDTDTWIFDDFIDLSSFVDDTVEKKDKEKSANSNSEMLSIVLGLPAPGSLYDICRKNVKAKSGYSISGMVNIIVGLPAPGWLKQTAAMKSDYQKFKNQGLVEQTAIMKSGNRTLRKQKQLDCNGTPCMHEKVLKKCLGSKPPLAEKVSSLILNYGTEALKKTATWKSDNQKTRSQEQSSTRKSDNQTPRNQEQLDGKSLPCMHEKKKSDGVRTLVAEKGSPSLLNNGTKASMTEKQPPLSLREGKPLGGGYSNGKKKKKRGGGCGLVVRRTGKGDGGEHVLSKTKHSILSWLIDNGALAENAKVVHKIKNDQGNVTKGSITRGGIQCNCCRKVWSLLEFEAHAGSNIHKPWINICLISGKSLMQCQSEAWEKEKKEKNVGFQTVGAGYSDPSDDTCGICADGGHLICCDGCLSTFHQECVRLKSLPEGRWYCPYCRCAFCMLADSGQDIPNQNFSMFSCNQCGCKYHRDCVVEKDRDEIFSNSLPFCGESCRKVATRLSDILGVSNPLDGGFSWTLLKRLDENEDSGAISDQRLSFIMGCNIKLSLALSVLYECFVPLVDPRTGLDMIVQAVYNCGSNYSRLNCERFYTMILEKDEEIISVATLRLHGTRIAEMPFVGTQPIYRRKGMCRRLLNSIEKIKSRLALVAISIKQLNRSHDLQHVAGGQSADYRIVLYCRGPDHTRHELNAIAGRSNGSSLIDGLLVCIQELLMDLFLKFHLPKALPSKYEDDAAKYGTGDSQLASVDNHPAETIFNSDITSVSNGHVTRWLPGADGFQFSKTSAVVLLSVPHG